MSKVASVDFCRVQVLNGLKSGELGSYLRRREEKLERLAYTLHARSEQVARLQLMRRQGVTRQPVIHDDTAPRGKIGNELESGTKSWVGEIHHDAKPSENSWGSEVEATALQLAGKALALKIYRNVVQIRGLWQSIRAQELALPLLRSGMIDLKYVEAGVRVTVGKCVKARAE